MAGATRSHTSRARLTASMSEVSVYTTSTIWRPRFGDGGAARRALWHRHDASACGDGRADTPVDVGLLDIRLPDRLGFELLEDARDGGPRWIVLSSFDLQEYVRAAFARGAAGYLLKTAPLSDLVAAIRRVAAGVSAYETRHMATLAVPPVQLSDRERTIRAGVVASRTNDEIAAELGLSSKSVEAYLTRLFTRALVSRRGWSSRSRRSARIGSRCSLWL